MPKKDKEEKDGSDTEEEEEEDVEQVVRKLLRDPEVGMINQQAMMKKLKAMGIKITWAKLRHIYATEKSQQVHKPVSKRTLKEQYGEIRAPAPFSRIEIDLADLPHHQNPRNQNMRYLLIAIDTFSRYAWVEPLTKKEALNVAQAFSRILDRMQKDFKAKPMNVASDAGAEFKNQNMGRLAEKFKFQQRYARPGNKHGTALVERFIGTLKGKIKRYISTHGKGYISVLQKLVKNYNNTIHSYHKAEPSHAIQFPKVPLLLPPPKVVQTIPVGKLVRILRKKGAFDKGDVITYSTELYEVVSVKRNKHFVKNVKTGKEETRGYDRRELQVVQQPKEDENEKEVEEYEEEVEKGKRKRQFSRKVKRAGVEEMPEYEEKPGRAKVTKLRSGRQIAPLIPPLEPYPQRKKGLTSKEKNYIKNKK